MGTGTDMWGCIMLAEFRLVCNLPASTFSYSYTIRYLQGVDHCLQ
jgi:hypothetical protein